MANAKKKRTQPVSLPMLPLRGLMVFPHMVLHFDVGRKKSVAALEQAMRELTGICGSCEGCTEGHCTFRDADIEELIRPAVTVPDWAREEADIAPDAKLDCHVDEGSGVITVCETFYDHDLSDIPAELLEALRKSGCCLSVLEDMLMDDDVIYDK